MNTTLKVPSQWKKTQIAFLLAGLLSLSSISAHADYTVMNDDLYPESIIQARYQARPQQQTQQPQQPQRQQDVPPKRVTIPFAKGINTLGPLGRTTVDKLISEMTGANIRIVGRPDVNQPTATATPEFLIKRANTMRDRLILKGVPAENITTAINTEPLSAKDDTYPGEIYISRKPVSALSLAQAQYSPTSQPNPTLAARYSNSTYEEYEIATPVVESQREKLVQFINESIQSKSMSPETGLRLLGMFLKTDTKQNIQPTLQEKTKRPTPQEELKTVGHSELSKPAIQTATIKHMPLEIDMRIVEAERNDTWEILGTDKTLQNTFERWAKSANWQVYWENIPTINNRSFVKFPASDFLTVADHVLNQAKNAAKAAGVNISIKAYPNRVLVISKEV